MWIRRSWVRVPFYTLRIFLLFLPEIKSEWRYTDTYHLAELRQILPQDTRIYCCLPSDIFSIRSAFRLFSLAAGRETACHYSLNLLLQDKKMENYNLALPAGRCLSANDDISSIIKQIRKLLSELRDRGIDDSDIIGLLSGKAKNARVRLGPDRMLVLADENPHQIYVTNRPLQERI